MKNPILAILEHFNRSVWPLGLRIKGNMRGYERKQGYSFDTRHPVTFTEKLQWYKMFYEHPDMTRMVDKYLFKQFIAEKLGEGYTIPLYGMWTSLDDFKRDYQSLPQVFVLKGTLQSDGKSIMVIDKSTVNEAEMHQMVIDSLNPKNTLINSYCHAYHNAVPRVIAEKFEASVGDQLYDYKFFCFDGVPFCIYVAQDHFGKDGSHISFYDLDWNKLDVQYGNHIVGDAEKPKHFDEMVEIAKKLSAGFPFLRVDFFDTDEKLYMAELTFYPGGGYTPYHPESFNQQMGELFKLPNKK
ncbi:MAG: hypothetical protein KBT10_07790 [Bacteroidales bacterium]|nr:hypothetical protein [Candidatus Sodaliphilus aphodohippi]